MESVKQLYIDAGSTLMIDGGSLYVPGSVFNQGTLVNHGTIAQTLLVNGGEAEQFVGGTYGGLALNPNGDDLGAVTVSIRGNQDCTDVPGETVLRCFDVASTVAPVTGATITFFYDAIDESGNNCDQMQAYHWQSGSWQLLTLDSSYGIGGRSCGANPRSIRVTGVTGFSPFVLKSTSAPTAIRLTNFSASGPVTGFNVFVCLLALGFIFGATAIHRNK
jgi:hypothetical protein